MVIHHPFSSVHFFYSMQIYVDLALVAWMSPFVAGRRKSDCLSSYPLVSFEKYSFLLWEPFSLELCLVPPHPCAMPPFHVVRTGGISQTRDSTWLQGTNTAASHFKLNQVIKIWVTSSIPISLSPAVMDYRTESPVPTNVWVAGIDPGMLSTWTVTQHMSYSNPPTQ